MSPSIKYWRNTKTLKVRVFQWHHAHIKFECLLESIIQVESHVSIDRLLKRQTQHLFKMIHCHKALPFKLKKGYVVAMKYPLWRCLAAVLGLVISVYAHAADKHIPPLQCADFLKQLGLARTELRFQGCTQSPSGALQATYTVAGKDLATVEAWAVHQFHMRKLRFACCGWDTPSISWKAKDGAIYEIGMGGEATINQRAKWKDIPSLTFFVTYYPDDPP